MNKCYRNKKGVMWIKVGFWDLMTITGNGFPICDECLKDLIGYNDIILIPYLNEAFCSKCGKERLKKIMLYPEDEAVKTKREKYYKEVLKLTVEEVKE